MEPNLPPHHSITPPIESETESAMNDQQAISVDIYDQIYNLRGTDPDYIERLAQTVDAKMRAVSAHGGTVDSLRVAVLAALNIADELAILRQRTKPSPAPSPNPSPPCAPAPAPWPECSTKSSKIEKPADRNSG